MKPKSSSIRSSSISDNGAALLFRSLSTSSMAAPRSVVLDTGVIGVGVGGGRMRDEEKDFADSPTSKKGKLGEGGAFPLSRWELFAGLGVFLLFTIGLGCVYLTMPAADYSKLKLPRTLSDLRMLKDHLATYANAYPTQFILGYCSTYIFMQTFMIPGTIFMSLLAGALFGVIRGLFLVVFNATAGASSCYFLSKIIGRPIVYWLWPDKLKFFQSEIAKRKDKLLNYMLFLRVTPTLPNLFINLASPIVDIPFHIFFLATVIGLIPASYITVRAGLALGDLRSVKDLYDFKTLSVLFLIGTVAIVPTLLKRKRVYE
ncbi:OLC1v1015529C1 [Oldenlandia corymbosa var. corymbosa]|uniref:OLC1v1015529C1 n=1 Tax=Oldenlandia corymbosa var. corymbosa TaxID=529605 RepID=A0AAV1E3F1_OLDCO|nr:OLC1v1015529C1 [Oldenlandia corymbosa var. corymbosa]